MPTPVPAGFRLGLTEPKDAAEAFARRALLQPSFRWQDVWQEEHARAFAVAGVTRLDILQVFRDGLKRAIDEGTGLAQFQKELEPALVAKGWWGDIEQTDQVTGEVRRMRFDQRRLQLIYDVNVRQSYAAGRWARIERLKARFPFVIYRTMRDERVRASHAAWDGVALPVDHEFWNTHFPPCGWSCRCTAFGIDEAGIERLKAAGFPIKRDAPKVEWATWHNPSDDTFHPVPRGIDPGFAYNPGKERDVAFFDAALGKALKTLPREAATVVTQMLFENPLGLAQKTVAFDQWVSTVLDAAAAFDPARPKETGFSNSAQYIGVIHPFFVRALGHAGVDLFTSVIGVSADDVIHALRDSKNAEQLVPRQLFGRLPTLLTQATALLRHRDTLLYVIDVTATDGKLMKLVLQLNVFRRVVGEDGHEKRVANFMRTAGLMDVASIKSLGAELLFGAP